MLFVIGYIGEGENLASYDLLRKPFTVSTLATAVAAALSHQASELHPIEGAAAAG